MRDIIGIGEFRRFAVEQQGPCVLPFLMPDRTAQVVTIRVIRIDLFDFANNPFSLVKSSKFKEYVSFATQDFSVVWVFLEQRIELGESRFVLLILEKTIGFLDLVQNWHATPFEFFSAAARTRSIRIKSHG